MKKLSPLVVSVAEGADSDLQWKPVGAQVSFHHLDKEITIKTKTKTKTKAKTKTKTKIQEDLGKVLRYRVENMLDETILCW